MTTILGFSRLYNTNTGVFQIVRQQRCGLYEIQCKGHIKNSGNSNNIISIYAITLVALVVKQIIFIDRFVSYSTQLFEQIESLLRTDPHYNITFVGPDKTKDILFSDQQVHNSKKIWSSGNYVRKIFSYIKNHKPAISHFVFELSTYGGARSAIRFPLLLLLAKLVGTKIVVTLHNIWFYKKESKWILPPYFPKIIPKEILKFFIKYFFKMICLLSHQIIIGTHEGEIMFKEFLGISSSKINVIQLGVSSVPHTDSVVCEEYKRRFGNKRIILVFGVISPRKNQEMAIKGFIRIFERIPNHVLVIAGKSTPEFEWYERRLKKLAIEKNLQNKILFLGHVSDQEIEVLFRISEMVLYPYRPMSDSTYAITFAIKHRKPSIVSNLPIFSEFFEGMGVLMVDPDDEEQLAHAIVRIAEDETLKNNLARQMTIVATRHSWKNSAIKHIKVYKKVLEA